MSTSEEILLQALHTVEEEETEDGDHTTHKISQEPIDSPDTTRENLSMSKGAAASVTTSRWKKIFTSVATLIASVFLFGGISMIGPFYPIVVSSV